ncbi:glycerophosphodiester phosphodiesterase family protein [Luteolibacter marinus]|uniref:glycerophosphodiester phosphodiesterase family protein n=1 Tax=Luteolibacter marinus TaxID=2776705 RepID=UPI0018676091|nr:glycerophosphodiester phosphodiesterase family protein [Luteolibacter marinus]
MKLLSVLPIAALFASMATAAELPNLIAHRGASHAAPENTIAAFKRAWEEGADGIEGDFHLSADGEVVCIHDADTKRVAGKKLVVANTPWATLAALDVGSWKSPEFKGERIPRLADVLDVLPSGKRFFLEIKDGPEIVAPIRRILMEKKADPARVVLISFNGEVVAACREALPGFQAHLVSDLKGIEKEAKRSGYLAQLKQCRAQGLQFKAASAVEGDWLRARKEEGVMLTSWTVDDVATARKVIGFGVDNITTNRPGPLRAELSE